MDLADKGVRALRSVDHVRVIEAKNGPTVYMYLHRLLICHTVIQCTTAFVASLS